MSTINFTPNTATDYIGLAPAIRLEMRKAIVKLESDPVSYGDPLGNKPGINLYGFGQDGEFASSTLSTMRRTSSSL